MENCCTVYEKTYSNVRRYKETYSSADAMTMACREIGSESLMSVMMHTLERKYVTTFYNLNHALGKKYFELQIQRSHKRPAIPSQLFGWKWGFVFVQSEA